MVEIQPLNCSNRFFSFFSSPSNVNQVRQFNIVGLVRGVPLFPFSHGAVMTCQHGGSWETFYIFAYCGGVVEIQPLNCSNRFFFRSPSNVNQVRQFNIVGLVRGVPLLPFSHGAVMTCQHGGSWETCYIFAYLK